MFVTWVRLSRDMVVLECDGDLAAMLHSEVVGRNLFDVYDGAEEQFRPGYELAFQKGHHNFATLYRDCVVACLCTRIEDHLLVCYRTIPMDGLTESLRQVEAVLTDPQAGS